MSNSPRLPIAEMTSAVRLEQTFLISQPQLRTTSQGDYYIAAYLSDATGKLNGRMWQASPEIFAKLPEEGFVMVKGRTEMYQDNLQLVIDAIRPVDAGEVDFVDFLPATNKNVDQMFTDVVECLRHIKNPWLRLLVKAFLEDRELMDRFRRAPAAIGLHHAYLGGLLEHTLSLLQLGDRVLPHYPELDADLIRTGLFLHDIGKIHELEYEVSFKYSDEGQLIGHIVKGILLIEEKMKGISVEGKSFPSPLRETLLHVVAAHHGQLDFGSPVTPRTPEAFAVHYLDNLDSKINLTLSAIAADVGKADWTGYIRALEAPLYKVRPPQAE